ncbi:hypothetical protein NLG97_g9104 [Lecanicillium saksenae]|uniref:Uncharacterized protein n=1 Tax=Lecanicillium saksenae TaxID=468837 RepID=A0ACC1QIT7_9HYPO|nr:hypothetical protein NLG97_g9104 [Lecanicillium saksenae]
MKLSSPVEDEKQSELRHLTVKGANFWGSVVRSAGQGEGNQGWGWIGKFFGLLRLQRAEGLLWMGRLIFYQSDLIRNHAEKFAPSPVGLNAELKSEPASGHSASLSGQSVILQRAEAYFTVFLEDEDVETEVEKHPTARTPSLFNAILVWFCRDANDFYLPVPCHM